MDNLRTFRNFRQKYGIIEMRKKAPTQALSARLQGVESGELGVESEIPRKKYLENFCERY
ncbi:hypothetical protein FACS1894191_5920 [Clostridia bacterium]|nr:hypothetical protein FACS1894191_5920 [Clostridia bacterium]